VDAIIEAINTGKVFRYITKPWDETELRVTIENARTLYMLQEKNKQLIYDLKQKVEEQERILKLFARYVPEAVVEKALLQSETSIFDGETKEITVLFCDIRDFTPLCEGIPPQMVVALLNDYYAIMTEAIKKHNGYAHQFIGDEIFATFGTPVAYPNNEENAVFCALEMIRRIEDLNTLYEEKVGSKITMGIGIHAGEVVAGNLGSEAKISYSVTGDTVNTGKRIETVTRNFPNTILISEAVFQKTKKLIRVKTWEAIALKGKKDKMQLYEVLEKLPVMI
jgi:class 3 adenylate cyclase